VKRVSTVGRVKGPVPLSDIEVMFSEFIGLIDRLKLSDIEAAVLCHCSPHTIRHARVSRQPPGTVRACKKIAKFVEHDRNAAVREDLRLIG
jgi:hypothetical protein